MIETSRPQKLSELLTEQLNTALEAQAKISRLQNEINNLSVYLPGRILDLEAIRQMKAQKQHYAIEDVFLLFRRGGIVRGLADNLVDEVRYQRSLLNTLSMLFHDGGCHD